MDGVERDDDDDSTPQVYPDAPVPRHERMWRHPSEMGEAMWLRSEPPLTIGRGLLVTSGAIGGLLALAVLWAMLPTNAGGGASAVSSEVVRTLRSSAASDRAVTSAPMVELDTAAERATAGERTTVAAHPTTTAARSATSSSDPDTAARTDASFTAAPAEQESTPDASGTRSADGDTSVEGPDASSSTPTSGAGPGTSGSGTGTHGGERAIEVTQATISVSAGASSGRAIAVSVGSSPLVLTTAGAVDPSTEEVTLAYASGQTTHAKVTMIYQGIAVLSPDTAEGGRPFASAAAPRAGDMVTVLSSTPSNVSVAIDPDGSLRVAWSGGAVAEGTPVVNAGGQLVGLCSRSGGGAKVLPVDAPLRRAMATASDGSTGSRGWLGVQLNADPKGSLTINYVDPHGPAAAAGVGAGDTIVSFDGRAMSSSRNLYDALDRHGPDDQVQLTVRHGDGTQVTVEVVLAVAPTSA